MPSYDRALHALRSWLDSWSGIGHVAAVMARHGYDEKGWGRRSTRPDGALPDKRDGHRVGAHAVAGGASGSVGCAEQPSVKRMRQPRGFRLWKVRRTPSSILSMRGESSTTCAPTAVPTMSRTPRRNFTM